MTTRRERKVQRNRQGLWEQRAEEAKRNPEEAPVYAFDLARARIRRLPREQHAQAWRDLAEKIHEFIKQHDGPPSPPTTA